MAIVVVDNSLPTSGDLNNEAWDKYNASVTSLLIEHNADGTHGSITTTSLIGVTTLTAAGNLDIGAYTFRCAGLIDDTLTSGRVVFASTAGLLADDADLTFSGDTLTATKIGAFEAAGAINFASQNMTNVDIDSGTIGGVTLDGAVAGGDQAFTNVGDMTFAAGSILASGSTNTNTLILRANDTACITLTTAATDIVDIAQVNSLAAVANLDIGAYTFRCNGLIDDSLTSGRVIFATTNGQMADDSDMTFSTDTFTATKIGAFEAAGAINFASQNMTNVDIDSGAIDATNIGAGTPGTGAFTTLSATGAVGFDGGAFTFNNSEADLDFRVASSGITNALFVEGSSGKVVLGGGTTSKGTLTVDENTNYHSWTVNSVAISDDASISLENYVTSNTGILWLFDTGVQAYGSVFIAGGGNSTIQITDPANKIDVADTDGQLCVIADGDSTYSIKNRLGATRVICMMFIGS